MPEPARTQLVRVRPLLFGPGVSRRSATAWRRRRRRACSTSAATPANCAHCASSGCPALRSRPGRPADPARRRAGATSRRPAWSQRAQLHPHRPARRRRRAARRLRADLDEPVPRLLLRGRDRRDPAQGARARCRPAAACGSSSCSGTASASRPRPSACSRPRCTSPAWPTATARCTTPRCFMALLPRAGLAVTQVTDAVGGYHTLLECAAIEGATLD